MCFHVGVEVEYAMSFFFNISGKIIESPLVVFFPRSHHTLDVCYLVTVPMPLRTTIMIRWNATAAMATSTLSGLCV